MDDEVGKYLPAYNKLMVNDEEGLRELKEPLKIWHLLSMQSGLDYILTRPGILRVIEEKFKTGSLPENINNCYKKAKEQAILKLQGDKNFQLALEQAWVKIDGFEKNLQEYSEDEAANEVKRILGNPATQEQLKLSRNVIIENCDKLDPKQRESLEEGLKIFKDSIRKASQEIWID